MKSMQNRIPTSQEIENDISQIKNRWTWQHCANFLSSFRKDQNLLRKMVSPQGDITEDNLKTIRRHFLTLWWWSWYEKVMNSFLFWLGVACLIIIALWP